MFKRDKTALGILAALMVLSTACSDTGSDESDGDSSGDVASGADLVTTVSARPDMVTGGDVLIEVAAESVDSVTVDGEDSEVEFTSAEGVSRGLVEGLPDGGSTIAVEAGGENGEVEVTNHPTQGPVFSGERLPMVTCTSDRYGLANSEPPECDAETVVSYSYVDSEGDAQPLAEGEEPPQDAETVTIDGEERPAILRNETGVINRGVYVITTLANGSSDAAPGSAADWDSEHWNGRLVYRFGGGCGTTYSQGFAMFGAPSLQLLADGYAFATNTLNTFQVQCQDIVSAEAAMMTKEHFVETYGVPVVTIGEGGSGGAIQQLLIAQNYPGILDAIAPAVPFPDALSISPGVIDCALLLNFYRSDAGAEFTDDQQRAVNGHATSDTCLFWEQTFVPSIDPTKCGFGDAVGGASRALPGLEGGLPVPPEEMVYDAETNPDGLRCTVQDSMPQVFAEDPETGFAVRPIDNEGVQYGLEALNAGEITPEQFVTLNERIGGFDFDANPVPERMVGTEEQVERLYATGRIMGPGPVQEIPVLATNVFTDDSGDIHDRVRIFSIDARLADSDGDQAPGLVLWTHPSTPDGDLAAQFSGDRDFGTGATRMLDEWATAILEDDSGEDTAVVLERTRPEQAVNTCFDLDGEVVDSGADVYDSGPCAEQFPVSGEPRIAAGGPLTVDIAKCSLQSLDDAVAAGTYEVEFTEAQLGRLGALFTTGVCDWTVPGVGQVPMEGTWQTFD